MADRPDSSDTDDDTEQRLTGSLSTGTPRWVKAFGVIALIVVALFVVLLVFGGGHGPGRHSDDAGGQRTPSSGLESADAGADTPPAGFAHGEQQP
jgi:hypothetical protein